MKGIFNTVLGQIEAQESKKYITLYGMNGYTLTDEIANVWKTTRITKNVFKSIGRLSVSFHKFFLIDVIYTLEELLRLNNKRISKRSLTKAIDALKELTDLRLVFEDGNTNSLINRKHLSKFNVTPTDWQNQYLDIYSDRVQRYNLTGHLLDADPGTGKTLGSLFLMECLGMDTIIIVSPKNAVAQVWEDTLKTRYRKIPTYWSSVSGTNPTLNVEKYIVHYEALPGFLKYLESINTNQLGRISVICDESHLLNDEKSLRSEAVVTLCNKYANYSLWMSGTPLKAMGKETIPLLYSIDPVFDKDARDRYVAVFGMASDRALDILANRIGIISHKVKKDTTVIGNTNLYRYEAKVSLPNGKEFTISSIRNKMRKYIEERSLYYKQNMDIYVNNFNDGISYYRDQISRNVTELSLLDDYLDKVKEIRKNYDPVQMKETSIYCNNFEKKKIIPILPRELKENFRKAKSVYKYVNLTIMGECLGTVLGKERSRCNRDIALNLGTMKLTPIDNSPKLDDMSIEEVINSANKKTILFTSFVEVIKDVSSDLANKGYYPAIVYGDTNKNLSSILSTFEKDDKVNPLVATFQSLSTAIPLVMANTIVMLNRPFRDYEYKQAVARAWRKGQTDHVYVIDVYLDTGNEDNISTRSKEIADEAAEIVAKIMGYDSKVLDSISNESCSTCSTGSIFVNDSPNKKIDNRIDKISSGDPIITDNSSDDKEPYYKTDLGFSLKEITELTDGDPIWDSEDGQVVLKDIINDSENPASYHSNKNSFAAW